jgi:hypothetical protein
MKGSCINYLYPHFPLKHLPGMLRIAALGAVVAGSYGALHDQVSYAISPEYFTRLKFQQFSYADFGWPPRAFAGEVGFLASWWVGLLGGWVLARFGLDEMIPPQRRKTTIIAFMIVLGTAALSGLTGALLGTATTANGHLDDWRDWQQRLNIEDLRGFAIVAWLHAAGYLGALAGVILAVLYVRRCRRLGGTRP